MNATSETKTYEMNFLPPRRVHFQRTAGGLLQMRVDNVLHPQVKLYRCFPLTARDRHISIRDSRDKREPEIGIIERIEELSREDQALVQQELLARYFIPQITCIRSIRDTYEILEWDVDTDRGPRRFYVKDVHDRMRLVGEDHFIIVDTEECRYEIQNLKNLSPAEQRLVLRHFYR